MSKRIVVHKVRNLHGQSFLTNFFSEKEVFKIMGFDRLRREGSQLEVQDLEKNRMLDIGKCHGACRHVQSVSDFNSCVDICHRRDKRLKIEDINH